MDGDAVAVCIICDDHIFDFQEDEAYIGCGLSDPSHHHRCLSDFEKTGKLGSAFVKQMEKHDLLGQERIQCAIAFLQSRLLLRNIKTEGS